MTKMNNHKKKSIPDFDTSVNKKITFFQKKINELSAMVMRQGEAIAALQAKLSLDKPAYRQALVNFVRECRAKSLSPKEFSEELRRFTDIYGFGGSR